ncbi:pyridoxal phosphate-dependent transferase [Zopfochytrium polystomum]|nr:pyridoxal phosphate-dependent transferase [Zopfochytrium polystomum]
MRIPSMGLLHPRSRKLDAVSVVGPSHLSSARSLDADIRRRILSFLNVTPESHSVIFTSNATGCFKLVGEAGYWSHSRLWRFSDSHTSIVGMREYVYRDIELAKGSVPTGSEVNVEESFDADHDRMVTAAEVEAYLFVFPAASNFNGLKNPLRWVSEFQKKRDILGNGDSARRRRKWLVMVDAASHGFIDMNEVPADLVALSLYKMFGYPTGVGCLIVRNSTAAPFLLKSRRIAHTVGVDFHQPGEPIQAALCRLFEPEALSPLTIFQVNRGLDWIECSGGWDRLPALLLSVLCLTTTIVTIPRSLGQSLLS